MRTECATVEDAGPFDVSEPLMLLSVGQSYQRGGDAYETAGSRGRAIAVASTDTTLCSRTVAGSWSARSARKAGSPRRVRTSRAERRTRAVGALSADPPSPKRRTTTWETGARSVLTPRCQQPGPALIHRRHPGRQRPLVARVEVQTGAHPQAHGGVSGGGGRYPDHAEPKRREDHSKGAKSRVVGKKDVVVESAADGDVGCNQHNVHGAEASHRAPRHQPW